MEESLDSEALDCNEEVANHSSSSHDSGNPPLQQSEFADLKNAVIRMQNQMKQMCEKMQGNQTDLSMQASVKRKASVVEEASQLSDDMPHNSKKSENGQL